MKRIEASERKKVFARSLTGIILLFSFLLGLLELQTVPSVYAGNDSWSSSGLLGGTILDIAIHPTNPQLIFATTMSGGVFKSTDAGKTWQSLSNMSCGTWYGSRIFFDKEKSGTLYYVGLNQLCTSHNTGDSWEAKPIEFATAPVGGGKAVLASEMSNFSGAIFIGNDFGISRSLDYGATWNVQFQPGELVNIEAISVAQSAPHIIYAGGWNGFYKSIDSGETWQSIKGNFAQVPGVYSISVDPSDANVVYLGTSEDGIFKTEDGGLNWIPIGDGLSANCIRDIVIHPGNQQIIYVGGGKPSYISSSSGTPGVYKSTDNMGLSWVDMMDGMGSRHIRSLAIDNGSPRTLYAGTEGAGIWKYTIVNAPQNYSISINGGSLFTNNPSVILNITAPAGTTEMIISNDGGFDGASWEPFAITNSWVITNYGSSVIPRTVYAKFKTSSKVSGLYHDDIILDQTPPTGSVTMSSNNVHTLIPNGVLNSQRSTWLQSENVLYLPQINKGTEKVTLMLTASDDLSGVSGMLISSDPNFSGATWKPYAGTSAWEISEHNRTVYVKFRDRAQNVSSTYSATLGAP